jgi:dihydrolipoamide dehydrogenase
MSGEKKTTGVAVIGGGPGGYPAAFLASDLGMDVTLIDMEPNPGGVCLYRGCIPSKALLHVARVIAEARHASRWGIEFPEPTVDIDRLREWKNSVVRKLTGGLGQLTKKRGINYIQGRASFLNPNTLRIEKDGGKELLLGFSHAVIATGSRPALLPDISIDSPRIMDSTDALELPDIPRTMLVVGGGYIGLELGSVYATLGTRVTVVEMTSGLMPGVDRDLVSVLSRRLERLFDGIVLNTKVVDMREEREGIRVRFEGTSKEERVFDRVLISVGRVPNSTNLGLESLGVRVDKKGFIIVDEKRKTNIPNIYAIGDVAGEPMLAHKATHEGRTVAEAIAGRKVAFEPRAIPSVVFTDPEIAWCGLTETEAREKKIPVKVARFPWSASGRATTLDRNDGVTKLILEPETDRILGVGIVGIGAGELISEGALAIEMAALASDLELTIHPHPTLSETIMEAAEVALGTSTHLLYGTGKSK